MKIDCAVLDPTVLNAAVAGRTSSMKRMRRVAIAATAVTALIAMSDAAEAEERTGALQVVTEAIAVAGQSNAVASGGLPSEWSGVTRGERLPGAQIWINAGGRLETMRMGWNTTQKPAKDHQFTNFGPEWGMAQELLEKPNTAYHFVKYAQGGTSMVDPDHWFAAEGQAPGKILAQFLEEIRQYNILYPSVPLTCFAWVQGEADRNRNDFSSYESAFRDMIRRVRNKFGNTNARVVWVKLTYKGEDFDPKYTDDFRDMQERLAGSANLNLRLVDADDLPKRDYVHFDARSTSILGHRIAKACRAP